MTLERVHLYHTVQIDHYREITQSRKEHLVAGRLTGLCLQMLISKKSENMDSNYKK